LKSPSSSFFLSQIHDITGSKDRNVFLFIIVELIIALNFRSMRFSILRPPHKWLLIPLRGTLIDFRIDPLPTVREAFGINMPSLT